MQPPVMHPASTCASKVIHNKKRPRVLTVKDGPSGIMGRICQLPTRAPSAHDSRTTAPLNFGPKVITSSASHEHLRQQGHPPQAEPMHVGREGWCIMGSKGLLQRDCSHFSTDLATLLFKPLLSRQAWRVHLPDSANRQEALACCARARKRSL